MSERALRVAITARAVAPWHGHGGLERHVADLVEHLSRGGVDVTLIVPPPAVAAVDAPSSGPIRTGRVTIVNVPYVTFPGAGRRGTTVLDRDTAYPVYGWRAGRAALRLAQAESVDIVHGLGASVIGYALARRRMPRLPPLVFNPQGLEEFGATSPQRAGLKVYGYWPLQRAVLACARAADAVLATDEALRPVVERHLGIDQRQLCVVPNAVDLERCARLATALDGRALRQRVGIADGVPLLLSVGRVEANKGFHVLGEALQSPRLRTAAWRWALVGDGPYRSVLARQLGAAGLESRMIAPGAVTDAELHAWYEAADLFVHPTLYEGSSLVTLEAMAHGRPVLATRAGGLPDKVKPGVTGWLVNPGSAEDLAGALADALAARSEWPEFGREGRRLAERTFTWPAVVARLLALYERLVMSRA